MLIFKTNIYEKEFNPALLLNKSGSFTTTLNLSKFIEISLKNDLKLLVNLDHCQEGITPEELERFFPETHRFAQSSTIQKLLNILIIGLQNRTTWFKMNTYHFCLIYDCLMRQVYLYNTAETKERFQLCPEMKGKLIEHDELIETLFFNTVFLTNKEEYNKLTTEDKTELGFNCPAQFGVLHGLTPNPDEMKLLPEPGFSYTMNA